NRGNQSANAIRVEQPPTRSVRNHAMPETRRNAATIRCDALSGATCARGESQPLPTRSSYRAAVWSGVSLSAGRLDRLTCRGRTLRTGLSTWPAHGPGNCGVRQVLGTVD